MFSKSVCSVVKVSVLPPKQTFWDKYLPLYRSLSANHPTAADTEAAAVVLKQRAQDKKMLLFGAIGGGLRADLKQKCLYYATGLKYELPIGWPSIRDYPHHRNLAAVFAYHDARAELYE